MHGPSELREDRAARVGPERYEKAHLLGRRCGGTVILTPAETMVVQPSKPNEG